MKKARYRSLTLAIHPNSTGFGWIAFEGPFSSYDWGTITMYGSGKNSTCLRRIGRLVDRFTPETLVLEAFEGRSSARHSRVQNLGRAIVALAVDRGVEVAIHPFADVQRCFAHLGVRTRWDIAEAVARQFQQFAHLLPRKPKVWEAQSRKLALFCAAALALTHYQRDATSLLDSLSS